MADTLYSMGSNADQAAAGNKAANDWRAMNGLPPLPAPNSYDSASNPNNTTTGKTDSYGNPLDAQGYVANPNTYLSSDQNAQNAANGVKYSSSQYNPNDPGSINSSGWGVNNGSSYHATPPSTPTTGGTDTNPYMTGGTDRNNTSVHNTQPQTGGTDTNKNNESAYATTGPTQHGNENQNTDVPSTGHWTGSVGGYVNGKWQGSGFSQNQQGHGQLSNETSDPSQMNWRPESSITSGAQRISNKYNGWGTPTSSAGQNGVDEQSYNPNQQGYGETSQGMRITDGGSFGFSSPEKQAEANRRYELQYGTNAGMPSTGDGPGAQGDQLPSYMKNGAKSATTLSPEQQSWMGHNFNSGKVMDNKTGSLVASNNGWATTLNGQPFSPYQQANEAKWIQKYGMDPKMWKASRDQAQNIPAPPSFSAMLSPGDLGAYLEYDPVGNQAFRPKQAHEMAGGFRTENGSNVQTYDEYRKGQGLTPVGGAEGKQMYGGGSGSWGGPPDDSASTTTNQNPANPGSRNWGQNSSVNHQIAAQTGYTGPFGHGEYQAWAAQHPQQAAQYHPGQTTGQLTGGTDRNNTSVHNTQQPYHRQTGNFRQTGNYDPSQGQGGTTSIVGQSGGSFQNGGQGLYGMGIVGDPNLKAAPGTADLMQIANQQSQANIGTQIGTSNLNNPNQYGPGGSRVRTLNPDGSYSLTDTLSDPLQQNYDAANALKGQLLQNAQGAANNKLDYSNVPNAQFDASGAPSLNGLNTSGVSGIPDASQNTLNQARDSVYNQQTQYLDKQFNRGQADLENKLANQGLAPGSEAYKRAMSEFNDQKQQAYSNAQMNAIQAGGQEQSRLFDLGAKQHGIGQQDALSRFGADLQGHTTGMNDALTQFNTGMQSRQQGVSEANQLHNSPINDMNALISQTQIQMPNFQGFSTTGGTNVDYLGAANMQNNANMGVKNAEAASQNNTKNAYMTLLGMGLSNSDALAKLAKAGYNMFNFGGGVNGIDYGGQTPEYSPPEVEGGLV